MAAKKGAAPSRSQAPRAGRDRTGRDAGRVHMTTAPCSGRREDRRCRANDGLDASRRKVSQESAGGTGAPSSPRSADPQRRTSIGLVGRMRARPDPDRSYRPWWSPHCIASTRHRGSGSLADAGQPGWLLDLVSVCAEESPEGRRRGPDGRLVGSSADDPRVARVAVVEVVEWKIGRAGFRSPSRLGGPGAQGAASSGGT
jgi:hypothetical protein